MIRKSIFVCFLIVIFTITMTSSLEAKRVIKKGGKQTKKQQSSATYFDPKWEKLPPKYKGHNLAKVYTTLLSRHAISQRTKGEFETTEEFEKKIERELAKPILGSLDINSLYAFKTDHVKTQYDADSEVMTASLWFQKYYEAAPRGGEWLDSHSVKEFFGSIWCRSKEVPGSFEGLANHRSLADRLNKEMTKSIETLALVFPYSTTSIRTNFEAVGSWSQKLGRNITIPIGIKINVEMKPAYAKKLKDNISAIIICKLDDPYPTKALVEVQGYIGNRAIRYVHIRFFEVWLYDEETGTILSKVKGAQADETEEDIRIEKERINADEEEMNKKRQIFRTPAAK